MHVLSEFVGRLICECDDLHGGSSAAKGVTKKQSEENSDSRFTQRLCHLGSCGEWHQKLQATCLGRRTMMNIPGVDCGILHLAERRMAVFFRLGLLAGLSRKLSVGLAGRSERKGFNAVEWIHLCMRHSAGEC